MLTGSPSPVALHIWANNEICDPCWALSSSKRPYRVSGEGSPPTPTCFVAANLPVTFYWSILGHLHDLLLLLPLGTLCDTNTHSSYPSIILNANRSDPSDFPSASSCITKPDLRPSSLSYSTTRLHTRAVYELIPGRTTSPNSRRRGGFTSTAQLAPLPDISGAVLFHRVRRTHCRLQAEPPAAVCLKHHIQRRQQPLGGREEWSALRLPGGNELPR